MNPTAENLLASAEWLHSAREFEGCCDAIAKCSVCACVPGSVSNSCAMVAARAVFNLFRPPDSPGTYWFGNPGTNRDERVLALCLAAAIANDAE